MMVAPVIEAGGVMRKAYLPAGEWRHLWSGKDFGSGWHHIPAPLGEPPVFSRPDSAFADLFRGLAA